jgi:hypothetical protein
VRDLKSNDRFPLLVVLGLWNAFWGLVTCYLFDLGVSPQDIEGHPTLSDMWSVLAVAGIAFLLGTIAFIKVLQNSLRDKARAEAQGFPLSSKQN